MWLRARDKSSPRSFWYQRNMTHSGPKRLGSTSFYEWFYCGFSWESRVPKENSDIEGTWHILAQTGMTFLLFMGDYAFERESIVPHGNSDIDGTWWILVWSGSALLLSKGECIVASTESREFPRKLWNSRNPTQFAQNGLVLLLSTGNGHVA